MGVREKERIKVPVIRHTVVCVPKLGSDLKWAVLQYREMTLSLSLSLSVPTRNTMFLYHFPSALNYQIKY